MSSDTAYTKELTGDTVKNSMEYNVAGDPKSTADEDGVKRSYTYDATYGRLLKIIDDQGTANDDYIQLSYDLQGNVRLKNYYKGATGELTRQSQWSYQHPTYPGLLWKTIEPAADGAPAAATTYGYHPSGRVSSVQDANGRTTTYEYDLFNRVTQVIQPATPDMGGTP